MLRWCLPSWGCAVARDLVCGAGTCRCNWYQPRSGWRAFARTGGVFSRTTCSTAGTQGRDEVDGHPRQQRGEADPGSARPWCSYWSELGFSREAGPLCGFWLSEVFRFSLGEAPSVLAGLLLLCSPPRVSGKQRAAPRAAPSLVTCVLRRLRQVALGCVGPESSPSSASLLPLPSKRMDLYAGIFDCLNSSGR